MNFFQQQERTRRKTKFLIVYFLCGVIGTIFTIYVGVMFLLFNSRFQKNFWDSEVFIGVSSVTLFIIAAGSIAKLIELSHGGGAVAQALGGIQVPPNSTEFDLKRLVNVVNEMSIASGISVPEIYLLKEDGINAFAAGNSPKDAAIGVTQGAIKYLNRDELQGVVAHEFSHILNGDMRLNMKLIAAISGILMISTIGYYILRAKTRGKNSGQIKIIGLALLVIGFCGALFARIIQSAISRQREFLADASAVQFTRNPEGIVGALKKIATISSSVTSPATNETAHLFFSNPISGLLTSLFATHPPIEDRIKAIEGSEVSIPTQPASYNKIEPPIISTLTGEQKIKAEGLISIAGVVDTNQINYAQTLLSSYPPALLKAVETSFSSIALIYALLLSDDKDIRENQLLQLSIIVPKFMIEETKRLYGYIETLPREKKLPLVHLSINTLKIISSSQYFEFEKAIDTLIKSDNQMDLFEFVLSKIVKRNLEPQFKKVKQIEPIYSVIDPIKEDCILLLSAIAWSGTGELNAAQKSFYAGLSSLQIKEENAQIIPFENINIGLIDKALNRCLLLKLPMRAKLLNACSLTASDDGYINPYEVELIRAIADTLECPIPPIVFNVSA